MNNLPAGVVLFAFAEGLDEDYLFRLIKPGMAAPGRRFAVVDAADAAVSLCCRANRAATIRKRCCARHPRHRADVFQRVVW
jgi:hypothetical protein